MTQCKKFYSPIFTSDGSGEPIDVGDTVGLVLRDNSEANVVVTAVSNGGHRICWDMTTGQPRSEDVIAIKGTHIKTCGYYNLHDGPEDSGTLDPVVQTS